MRSLLRFFVDFIVLTVICTGGGGEIHEQIMAGANPVCKRKISVAETPTHCYAVFNAHPRNLCYTILYKREKSSLLLSMFFMSTMGYNLEYNGKDHGSV